MICIIIGRVGRWFRRWCVLYLLAKSSDFMYYFLAFTGWSWAFFYGFLFIPIFFGVGSSVRLLPLLDSDIYSCPQCPVRYMFYV